ncbi:MAG TPA: sigma-70 family RNA polymerase sigma factor [Planctomycetota bacterium]|nr:sigma-70 family RNA polymerase sigma factor [Planctomycetota bacterium]
MSTRQALESAIERVQQGDREMFSVVVEAYHIQIRTYLSALVHDRFDAEDLAQQTFIFAYQHISEYEPGTNFIAWLKAIAFNHVRDYRSSFQRSMSAKRELREEICRKTNASLEPASMDPRLEMLENCVEKLPEAQRSFLKTVCSRRSTLEEVAAEMNRSSAAVRKNLSRLYDTLRLCVEQHLQRTGVSV